MNVRVYIQYEESPTKDDQDSLLSLGRSLTNNRESVVVREAKSNGLIVEFTMPTETQYKAVEKIDRAIRWYAGNRTDSGIEFPKTEAERARARRKAARRRARSRAAKPTRQDDGAE
jgi:hypothetical protein